MRYVVWNLSLCQVIYLLHVCVCVCVSVCVCVCILSVCKRKPELSKWNRRKKGAHHVAEVLCVAAGHHKDIRDICVRTLIVDLKSINSNQ